MSISKDQMSDSLIAKVGNKEITVAEFKARSELTIRPDNVKDKFITLNNLIIEKILALEAEKHNTLESNPAFRARIKGIKEQMMREKLYESVAYNKAAVDTNELKTAYKLSIREYELEFYRMHRELAQKVKAAIDTMPGKIDYIFKSLFDYAGKEPVHKVKYKDPDNDEIHRALFSKPLMVGDVIGPIELGKNDFLVMKVLDWTSYPLISGIDQQERWNEVQKIEHRIRASEIWQSYGSQIMHGKRIEFDRRIFNILANWLRRRYINEQEKIISSGNHIPEIPFNESGLDLSSPFFTFENKVWTVGDFRNELMSRPLLFRTIDLDSSNFNFQFEAAIADILENHCLTREAYENSLNNGEEIKRTVGMWKDSYIADNHQKNVIDSALKEGKVFENDSPGILKFWESYLADLQKKYSGSVSVNFTAFKNISLTSIDMFAFKPGMPFPSIVPNFPTYLSTKTIDFISNNQ